jgi:hypothetical protein
MVLNMMPKTLYRIKTFGCFELKFSPLSTFCFQKKTSSPPSKVGKDFSLFVLLITDELVQLRFCRPSKLCATRRDGFIRFSFAVFR